MDDYKPSEGHRVRVTFEGVIDEDGDLIVRDGRIHCGYVKASILAAGALERLPDPEPDYAPGDVVRDVHGEVLMRVPGSSSTVFWVRADGYTRADSEISRPLTPLVLNGKPVTDGA